MPSGGVPNFKVPNDLLDRIRNMRSEDVLDEFREQIDEDEVEKVNKIEQERSEERRDEDRFASLSIRGRVLLKLRENPGALLEEVLTPEEMEELALMILEALL